MNRRAVLLAGAAVVLAYLAAVLLTEQVGLGTPKGGVLEDTYDRQAYQQRGRWIASGGRPYLDEFSEYPQLTTWLMGLPYLAFDHTVERGEPFGAVHAAREAMRAGGVPYELAKRLLPIEQPYRKVASQREIAQALAPYPDLQWGRVRAGFEAAAEAEARRKEELNRDAGGYGDAHHVFMALWFLALLALTTANLERLGHRPAWALLLLLPGSLFYGFNRFDLVVTTTVAAAFFFQFRGRTRLAAFVLGLAIMVKWVPVVFLPLFISANVHALRAPPNGEDPLGWVPALIRGAIIPGLIATAVVVVTLGITFAWGGGGVEAVTEVFDWHRNVRQPNHSSFLTLLTNPDNWGWFERDQRDSIERVFKLLQLAPGFGLALLPIRSTRGLVLGCMTATLFTIVFSEFFSPQWVLWLTAMGIYVAPKLRSVLVLVVALELVMYTQLPLFWYRAQATGEAGAFWTVTNVRMTLLLVFLGAALALYAREAWAQRPSKTANA